MFVLIEKSSKTIFGHWENSPKRVPVPGTGDYVMGATAPMDIGSSHVLRKATVIDPSFDPATQVRDGPTYDVADVTFDTTKTYTIRAKTAQELADDQQNSDISNLQNSIEKLAFIQIELIDQLLTQGTIQNTDFTAGVRTLFQNIKTIVDRAKP